VTVTATDSLTLLTRLEVAYRLGVNPQTVTKWIEEGLPVAERGRGRRPSRYEEASVRRWVAAREKAIEGQRPGGRAPGGDGDAPNLIASRARKELAQAIEAEQRVALRAGKLIPVEEVDKLWSGQVAAIRARLLSWPTALSDRLHRVAVIEGPPGVERVLFEATHDALRELSGGERPPAQRRRTRRHTKKRKTTPKRRKRM
jgi:phage terminase Nu1 subunit (DNA packaging protein)